MNYAVEARIFNNGRIVAKVRDAMEGEVSDHYETEKCDIWIDVFPSYKEAQKFCGDYRRA